MPDSLRPGGYEEQVAWPLQPCRYGTRTARGTRTSTSRGKVRGTAARAVKCRTKIIHLYLYGTISVRAHAAQQHSKRIGKDYNLQYLQLQFRSNLGVVQRTSALETADETLFNNCYFGVEMYPAMLCVVWTSRLSRLERGLESQRALHIENNHNSILLSCSHLGSRQVCDLQ